MKQVKILAPVIAVVGLSLIVVGCTNPLATPSDSGNVTGSGQHMRGEHASGSGAESGSGKHMRGGPRGGSGAMNGGSGMMQPPGGSGGMMPPGGSGAMMPPDGSGSMNQGGQPPSDGQTPPEKPSDDTTSSAE